MIKTENWARAFINAAKTPLVAEEALQYLNVFCNAAMSLSGDLSGKNDADRFARIINQSQKRFLENNAENFSQQSFTLAERFIQLMLRKGCLHQYKKITGKIEKIIDKQKGIEDIIVEATVDLNNEFLEQLKEKIKKLIGANEIKITQCLIPELIGGIRLRWGSMLYDGSVKRALEMMALEFKSQRI